MAAGCSRYRNNNEDISGSDNETRISTKFSASATTAISLESDSLPESSNVRTIKRRKRMVRRPKHSFMDVDPPQNASNTDKEMDVDGFESHISSSDSDSGGNGDGEADDEQSDWVGYASGETDPFDPSDRRSRRAHPKVHMSQLQKRLERFALEGAKGEMGIEFKIKDRPNSAKFTRLLMQYRLEVVNRQRGNVVLRKKANNCSAVADETGDSERFESRDFDYLLTSAIRDILGSCGPDFKTGGFDETTNKGSVIASSADIQLIWAALSSVGSLFDRRVAVHFNALTEYAGEI